MIRQRIKDWQASYLSNHPWRWFAVLWFVGFMGCATLAYFVKLCMRLVRPFL